MKRLQQSTAPAQQEPTKRLRTPDRYYYCSDDEQESNTIKVMDIPERFIRPEIIADCKLTQEEINLATDNIAKSIADYHGTLISSQLTIAIKNTLILFSQEFLEVPYIWTYKKDLITKDSTTTIISRADLWHIFDLEHDFRKFLELRDVLTLQNSLSPYSNKVLSEAKNIEELYDLKAYINFIQQEETDSNNAKYIHKGLRKIVDKFGVKIPLFIQNLYSETKHHQPINENLTPLEIVQQFYPESKAPDELLRQSIELFALEISVDPMFRKFVRNNYMKYGFLVTSGPLEVISNNNECWPYCFWKIRIQEAFNIGGEIAQILHYKNQNLIDITFQLSNEEEFMEILKSSIVNENSISACIQWNIDAVFKAYDILRSNIESWLITKIKVNAEQRLMEQCMLSLEKKINVKPFRTSSIIPRVFALVFGTSECICCVYINEHGEKTKKWFWPSLKSISSKENNEFLDALNNFNPHVVVIQSHNSKTKFFLTIIKKIVYYYNKNQSEKSIVVVTDEKIKIAKMKYEKEFKCCEFLARMAQNPLMEYFKLGNKIMTIQFHHLQFLLSEDKLMKALDRAFINVVNEMGVDINSILKSKVNRQILDYVCGFGPQRSMQFRDLILKNNLETNPVIDSRIALKDYLTPKIYQNSSGFLKICPNPIELFDNSRIHPDFYNLAHEYLNSDIDNSWSSQQYFLMQLIDRENNDPFDDRRKDYEVQTFDQVFEMITKETIYPGIIIPVTVKNITNGNIKVHLNSGFECNIGWNYIDDNNIKKGDALNALVKSINKEDFTIALSCKQIDLENGHCRSLHNKLFDKFIDQEAKQNYQPPVKPKPPRTITHTGFKRVSAKEAEVKLSKQQVGSYIIRPTTTNPDKLSITWKIYDNIYRHLHIIEVESESGLKLFVENEQKEYKNLDELLTLYIENTNQFIYEIIHCQIFKQTKELLNKYLDTFLNIYPEFSAYGLYMDSANPGCFTYGYKFYPGSEMLEVHVMFRPYGFNIDGFCYHNFEELRGKLKRKYREQFYYDKKIHDMNILSEERPKKMEIYQRNSSP